MRRLNLYLALTFALLIGAWGCSRSETDGGLADRLQSLEAKTVRLEDDFRAATAQRDLFRRKFAGEEELRAKLQVEVNTLTDRVRELDAVKAQLARRTAERDQLVTQYESFRKNLKEMLGQADVTLNELKGTAVPTGAIRESTPVRVIAPETGREKVKSGL